MNLQPISVKIGLRDIDGMWHMVDMYNYPDENGKYADAFPVDAEWPDGIKARLIKISENGRALYERVA